MEEKNKDEKKNNLPSVEKNLESLAKTIRSKEPDWFTKSRLQSKVVATHDQIEFWLNSLSSFGFIAFKQEKGKNWYKITLGKKERLKKVDNILKFKESQLEKTKDDINYINEIKKLLENGN